MYALYHKPICCGTYIVSYTNICIVMHVSQANIFIHDSDEVQSIDHCCRDHTSDFQQHHFSLIELALGKKEFVVTLMKDKRYGHPPHAIHTFILGSLLCVSTKVQINFCNAVKVKRLIRYQQTTIFSKNSIGLVEENHNKIREETLKLFQAKISYSSMALPLCIFTISIYCHFVEVRKFL